jgi:hypothetical protein
MRHLPFWDGWSIWYAIPKLCYGLEGVMLLKINGLKFGTETAVLVLVKRAAVWGNTLDT